MKQTLVLALMLLGSIGLFAQGTTKSNAKNLSPTEKADKVSTKFQKKFGLTPEQTAQIKTIALSRATDIQNLKAKNIQDKKTLRLELNQIRANWEKEVSTILTAEQFKTYQDMREAQMKKAKATKQVQPSEIEAVENDGL